MADSLELIEERRAARKAAVKEQYAEQRAVDLEAIDAIEAELGDSNVAVIDVPFTPGLPTCLAVRCPSTPEVKRYQSRIKGAAQNKEVDAIAAAEEIGLSCLRYPDKEKRAAVIAARPGVVVTCGNEALKLAQGRAASEGKD